jgi:signal transduction histidine kinase
MPGVTWATSISPMDAAPRLPPLRRLPPAAWMALPWCAFVIYATAHGTGESRAWPAALATGLVVAVAAALLSRWALASIVLLLAGSAAVTITLASEPVALVQVLTVDIAVSLIAVAAARRVSITAAGLAAAAVAAYPVIGRAARMPASASVVLATTLTVVVAWLIGNSIRQSRHHAEMLRSQSVAQAVAAERLRIAREVHDMVAHSIGIIAIQAGMGSRVIDTQPAEARNALAAIEDVSRDTLAGLRRMLGVLRRVDPGGAPPAAPGQRPLDGMLREAAPGLADLERLAATAQEAGVRVDIRWHGRHRPLPADVDMSAFRIIQEALTNVMRHAGASHCQVSIAQRHEDLSIEVVDDGRGGCIDGTGFGITGMRERADLLHGDLHAGPAAGGGFRVTARLPVPVRTR